MISKATKLSQLFKTTFTNKFIWLTLTYDDEHLPDSEEAAYKDTVNYIRRLRRLSAEPLKYVIITHARTENGEPTIIHHHVAMNFIDINAAERLWNKGRSRCQSLQFNTCGFNGIAQYLAAEQCKIRHNSI